MNKRVTELIVNRGWKVLLDGMDPAEGWEAPDESGYVGKLFIGNDHITKIVLMTEKGETIGVQDDWFDADGSRRPAWLILEVNGIFRTNKITHVVYGGNNVTDLLVTTADGVAREIDEVTTYIRAEGEW